jgi:hypothetical protein
MEAGECTGRTASGAPAPAVNHCVAHILPSVDEAPTGNFIHPVNDRTKLITPDGGLSSGTEYGHPPDGTTFTAAT